jgi:hypothetical protein
MSSTTAEKHCYTCQDLMTRWDVSRTTLHCEVVRGRLRKPYIGGSVRFMAEHVAEYERQAGGLKHPA